MISRQVGHNHVEESCQLTVSNPISSESCLYQNFLEVELFEHLAKVNSLTNMGFSEEKVKGEGWQLCDAMA